MGMASPRRLTLAETRGEARVSLAKLGVWKRSIPGRGKNMYKVLEVRNFIAAKEPKESQSTEDEEGP